MVGFLERARRMVAPMPALDLDPGPAPAPAAPSPPVVRVSDLQPSASVDPGAA